VKRQDDRRWAGRETAVPTALPVVQHPTDAVIVPRNAVIVQKGVAIAHLATVHLTEVMVPKDAVMVRPAGAMALQDKAAMAGHLARLSTCGSLSSLRALTEAALTEVAVPRRVTAADTRLQAMAEAGAIQLPAATVEAADRPTVGAEGRRIATAVDRMVDVDISTALDSWPALYVTKAVKQHVIATLPSSETRKPRVHCFFI
jgi:hypothetical protein